MLPAAAFSLNAAQAKSLAQLLGAHGDGQPARMSQRIGLWPEASWELEPVEDWDAPMFCRKPCPPARLVCAGGRQRGAGAAGAASSRLVPACTAWPCAGLPAGACSAVVYRVRRGVPGGGTRRVGPPASQGREPSRLASPAGMACRPTTRPRGCDSARRPPARDPTRRERPARLARIADFPSVCHRRSRTGFGADLHRGPDSRPPGRGRAIVHARILWRLRWCDSWSALAEVL